MKLFGKKKEEKDDFFGNSSNDNFDINDIDLPPLPNDRGNSSKDSSFSKKVPQNRDLPPLPEPPKPMNHNPSLPQKHSQPQHYTSSHHRHYSHHPKIVESEKPHHKVSHRSKAPVFVRIDKYKEALGVIKDLKEDLDKLNGALDSIKSSKKREEEIISGWTGLLSELSTKLNKINDQLFEPDNE